MTKACPTDNAPRWESRAEPPLARIADAIADWDWCVDREWCVSPGFLSPEEVSALRVEATASRTQGALV